MFQFAYTSFICYVISEVLTSRLDHGPIDMYNFDIELYTITCSLLTGFHLFDIRKRSKSELVFWIKLGP